MTLYSFCKMTIDSFVTFTCIGRYRHFLCSIGMSSDFSATVEILVVFIYFVYQNHASDAAAAAAGNTTQNSHQLQSRIILAVTSWLTNTSLLSVRYRP